MADVNPGFPLLVAGVTYAGRLDPPQLWAGESDPVTDSTQAADGQALSQYQVIMLDVNGRVVPYDATEFGYASGTVTLSSTGPANADTVTINGVAITFVTSGATGAQVNIGPDLTTTAASLAALINGVPDTVDQNTSLPVYGTEALAGTGVNAVAAAGVVTVYANAPGTAGNAITLAKSGTNIAISAATLAGGAAESDVVPKRAAGVTCLAVAAATPGNDVPFYTAGIFNHAMLVWPAGLATLAQRRRVFEGTPIGVRQLL